MEFEEEFNRMAEGEIPSEEITPTPEVVEPEPIEPVVEQAPIMDAPLAPEPELAPAVDWEHKYNTLKGMYKHDMAELKDEFNQLKDNQIEETPIEKPSNKVIDDFWEIYPDLKDPMLAIINEVVSTRIEEVVNMHIKPIESTVQKSAEERFIEDLERAHRDWRDVLDSDGFREWHEGLPYKQGQAVNEILNQGTSTQVNDLLTEYKQAKQVVPVQPTIPLTPATPQIDPRVEKMRALAAVDSNIPIQPQSQPELSFEEEFMAMCSK